jgi:acetyl-CoA carboxylase carboxyltransferase component
MNSSADAVIFIKKDNIDDRKIKFISKMATFIVTSMNEAFDLCHKIISLMDENTSAIEKIWRKGKLEPDAKPQIPDDLSMPFDVIEKVIIPTFDRDSFLEFFRDMNDPLEGPSLITGMARLNGTSVGIIADQPAIKGGAPDAPGTEKFRIFTELLNENGIPLVMLSNAPGFLPGTKQERLRIQQIGAESLNANILGRIPVVSVVLNQNYGGRQIQAFSKSLRPGIVYLALEKSILAVMGGQAAFDLFHGAEYRELIAKKQKAKAEKIKSSFLKNFNAKASAANDAMKTGILDWLIPDIQDLREHLLKALPEAQQRCKSIFFNEDL